MPSYYLCELLGSLGSKRLKILAISCARHGVTWPFLLPPGLAVLRHVAFAPDRPADLEAACLDVLAKLAPPQVRHKAQQPLPPRLLLCFALSVDSGLLFFNATVRDRLAMDV